MVRACAQTKKSGNLNNAGVIHHLAFSVLWSSYASQPVFFECPGYQGFQFVAREMEIFGFRFRRYINRFIHERYMDFMT